MCRVLDPTAGGVTFTTEPGNTYASGGARVRAWYVTCDDRNGNYLAQFIWDADTRQLLWIGCHWPLPQVGLLAKTSAESVRTARWWLAALGMSRWGTRWQLVRAVREESAWCVQLRSPEQEAMLTVDSGSGNLTYLHCWRPPSTTRQHTIARL